MSSAKKVNVSGEANSEGPKRKIEFNRVFNLAS